MKSYMYEEREWIKHDYEYPTDEEMQELEKYYRKDIEDYINNVIDL